MHPTAVGSIFVSFPAVSAHVSTSCGTCVGLVQSQRTQCQETMRSETAGSCYQLVSVYLLKPRNPTNSLAQRPAIPEDRTCQISISTIHRTTSSYFLGSGCQSSIQNERYRRVQVKKPPVQVQSDHGIGYWVLCILPNNRETPNKRR